MNKRQSFEYLKQLGLNIHKYYVPQSFKEFYDLANNLVYFTVRTDIDTAHKGNLPFYIIDMHDINQSPSLYSIWEHSTRNNLVLIVSDAIHYDKDQKYNAVVNISKDGKFMLEASALKIPLRKMYEHPANLLTITGSIASPISTWQVPLPRYGIDRIELRNLLEYLYSLKIYDRNLELTVYPYPVGVLYEPIVFWQIK